MATSSAQKLKLSSSTDGAPIKIAATSTPGTAIHTATSSSDGTVYDEVWLYAFNSHTQNVVLTVEFGGATPPDQNIVLSVSPNVGLVLVVPGLILENSATVKAFAATANKITISGYVNRIAYA